MKKHTMQCVVLGGCPPGTESGRASTLLGEAHRQVAEPLDEAPDGRLLRCLMDDLDRIADPARAHPRRNGHVPPGATEGLTFQLNAPPVDRCDHAAAHEVRVGGFSIRVAGEEEDLRAGVEFAGGGSQMLVLGLGKLTLDYFHGGGVGVVHDGPLESKVLREHLWSADFIIITYI